jgi:hypothetical protein
MCSNEDQCASNPAIREAIMLYMVIIVLRRTFVEVGIFKLEYRYSPSQKAPSMFVKKLIHHAQY